MLKKNETVIVGFILMAILAGCVPQANPEASANSLSRTAPDGFRADENKIGQMGSDGEQMESNAQQMGGKNQEMENQVGHQSEEETGKEFQERSTEDFSPQPSPQGQEEKAGDCAAIFQYPPANLEKITHIGPMGSLHGEHVAPIDHQYYQNFNNDEANIEVYAPGDGIVTDIGHMGSFRGDDQREPFDDYRIIIKHTCTMSSIFIHIDKLSQKLMEGAPEFGQQKFPNIPVKAGEVIGWFDSNVDYNVVDKAVTINLIEPKSYAWDENRLHIKDPFDYFSEPVRKKLIAKSLRTAKPEGGFIDYDKDGTLLGTWFREGTNGWQGLRLERYWADHLAIVYDSIDPEQILFSVGTYEGKARQFGVKDNMPDPAEVTSATGLVKYELVESRLYDGDAQWDFRKLVKGLKMRNGDNVQGVALVQLIEDRKLKVEVFPGKAASEVNGFTAEAQVYGR
ncbi:hypothetical protein HYU14_00090 [Candidatus Woesearchaeota archaeon]|nr:hypothetical protein [Candidatus Woesearchaeota archaeon]